MSKHVNWSGVFPAVTTQFNADFSVNLEETHTVISTWCATACPGWWYAAASARTPR